MAATGLPDGFVTALSCSSPSVCWASGVTAAAGTTNTAETITGGFLASSSDGGETFEVAALPQGVGAVLNVSCPSSTTCFALASQKTVTSNEDGLVLFTTGTATSAAS